MERSILDVAAALDPPLRTTTNGCFYTLKSFSRLLLILPVDTGRKLNVHKMLRRRPGRPVPTGMSQKMVSFEEQGSFPENELRSLIPP